MRNVSFRSCRENQNTHFVFNNFFLLNLTFLWVKLPQMAIWLMCTACWIPKATNIRSVYVTLLAFPLQQWLHERASLLYVHCLYCWMLILLVRKVNLLASNDWRTRVSPVRSMYYLAKSTNGIAIKTATAWNSGVSRNFVRVGGGGLVQQIRLRTEGRENGDLGGGSHLVRSSAQFAIRFDFFKISGCRGLLRMYFPRNWEFGSTLSKLRNFGWGVLNPQSPPPPRYTTGVELTTHQGMVPRANTSCNVR
jgi:hypothetical protein